MLFGGSVRKREVKQGCMKREGSDGSKGGRVGNKWNRGSENKAAFGKELEGGLGAQSQVVARGILRTGITKTVDYLVTVKATPQALF